MTHRWFSQRPGPCPRQAYDSSLSLTSCGGIRRRLAVSIPPLERSTESRLHAAHAPLDGEAVPFQGIGEDRGGMVLLVVQLRMGVNVQADFHHFLAQRLHTLRPGLLVACL